MFCLPFSQNAYILTHFLVHEGSDSAWKQWDGLGARSIFQGCFHMEYNWLSTEKPNNNHSLKIA